MNAPIERTIEATPNIMSMSPMLISKQEFGRQFNYT